MRVGRGGRRRRCGAGRTPPLLLAHTAAACCHKAAVAGPLQGRPRAAVAVAHTAAGLPLQDRPHSLPLRRAGAPPLAHLAALRKGLLLPAGALRGADAARGVLWERVVGVLGAAGAAAAPASRVGDSSGAAKQPARAHAVRGAAERHRPALARPSHQLHHRRALAAPHCARSPAPKLAGSAGTKGGSVDAATGAVELLRSTYERSGGMGR